jgi:hypothetical protein
LSFFFVFAIDFCCKILIVIKLRVAKHIVFVTISIKYKKPIKMKTKKKSWIGAFLALVLGFVVNNSSYAQNYLPVGTPVPGFEWSALIGENNAGIYTLPSSFLYPSAGELKIGIIRKILSPTESIGTVYVGKADFHFMSTPSGYSGTILESGFAQMNMAGDYGCSSNAAPEEWAHFYFNLVAGIEYEINESGSWAKVQEGMTIDVPAGATKCKVRLNNFFAQPGLNYLRVSNVQRGTGEEMYELLQYTSPGSNVVGVYSMDGFNSMSYATMFTVKIPTVKSNDATLKTLTVSQGTFSPAFNASTTSYTVNVANSVESIALTGTASHEKATLT